MNKIEIVAIISGVVIAVVIIILVIIILSNSGTSTSIPASTMPSLPESSATPITAPSVPSAPAPTLAPISSITITTSGDKSIAKGVNTTEIISMGGYKYYLLCLWQQGFTPSSLASLINENNENSYAFSFGNVYFTISIVDAILAELGSGVSVGSYKDLNNFTDSGYFCTQNSLYNIQVSQNPNNSSNIYLINSTNSNGSKYVIDATPYLDYIDSVYVTGGIVVPPKPKKYKAITYVAPKSILNYTSLSDLSDKNWTFISSGDTSAYNSNICSEAAYYYPKFLLLKTTGKTILDSSIASTGYYVSTTTWLNKTYFTKGYIALTPSCFPPFAT